MKSSDNETIAAIATPLGEGGISVVRISGPEAIVIADKGFLGKKKLLDAQSHTAHYGIFRDPKNREVDEVVATVFRKPNSYTGENVVELSCHGGIYLTKNLLRTVVEYGARHAEPGEFTMRAFLNGRIDLIQAEAVADLIHSRSEMSTRASINQLNGILSERIRNLRESLIESLSLIELELDFAEENLEFVEKKELLEKIRVTTGNIDTLLSSYTFGKIVREGIKTVIVGAPNVGKSSILNALLEEERAIVTDLPGTTRDIIEENVNIDGVLVRLIDTAGLRATDHIVEAEGVRRAEDLVRKSDLILLVLDSSKELERVDIETASKVITELKQKSAKCIILKNKTDLPGKLKSSQITQVEFLNGFPIISVSATEGSGLNELRKVIVDSIGTSNIKVKEGMALVTAERHFSALSKAKTSCENALYSVQSGKGSDLVAIDLRDALDFLGEIIGTVTTDDILNDIFSKFCIGK